MTRLREKCRGLKKSVTPKNSKRSQRVGSVFSRIVSFRILLPTWTTLSLTSHKKYEGKREIYAYISKVTIHWIDGNNAATH